MTFEIQPAPATAVITFPGCKLGSEIRLADHGKPNAAELTRIEQAIVDVPRVEVQELSSPSRAEATAPRELVNLAEEQRLLVLHNAEVSLLVVKNNSVRVTTIHRAFEHDRDKA